MKKQLIVGYLVLDEGQPVRAYIYKEGRYYWTNTDGKHGVSLFPTRVIARRVKRFLNRKYMKTAAQFFPHKDENEERCYKLWRDRATMLRISSVVKDAPTIDELREVLL